MQKGFGAVPIIIGISIALAFTGLVYFGQEAFVKQLPQQKACTLEAKICPDGSGVGRTGPNCEFAECPQPKTSPASAATTSAKLDECIQGYKARYKDIRYKERDVIVIFQDNVTKDLAEQFLASLGLTFKSQQIQGSMVMGAVGVEVGKEIEVMCQLEQDSKVKFVRLEGIITLEDCSKGPC